MQTVYNPGHRTGHAMAYDRAHDKVLLFGGYNGSHPGEMGDTWLYDPAGNNWTEVSPVQSPPPGTYTGFYDPSAGAIQIFGAGIIWEYNYTANSWTNVSTDIGPAIMVDCLSYDPVRDEIIIHRSNSRSEIWIYGGSLQYPSGEFTSRPFDTGGSPVYSVIRWTATVPAGTDLRFQLRSAPACESLPTAPFIGPDGTAGTFYTALDRGIAEAHDGHRWLQYRAYFNTSDSIYTPVLDSVTIQYNLRQSLEVTGPSEGDVWSRTHDIKWSASDPDNDALLFDIYLENGISSVRLASNLSNETRLWSWTASSFAPGTYRIRVVARDDNPSIPITVQALSGNFTVPGPNRPPHVELVWPPDRSLVDNTTVRLLWNGTDPDRDLLTYSVQYSNLPLSQGHYTSEVTQDGWFLMANLAENTTYYWMVDASDGIFASTDVPAGEWSFTVAPVPKNHRPRITSAPPTTAKVNETYLYLLTVEDIDLDPLELSLVQGPSNMTMASAMARLRWVPAPGDEGLHNVTVRVSDGKGGYDEQTFTINVTGIPVEQPPPPPPERAPQCRILYPANGTVARGVILARGTALNGTRRLVEVRLRLDGGNWSVAGGLDDWSLRLDTGKLRNGRHRLEAQATDGDLSSSIAFVDFMVQNPEPPTTILRQDWCLPAAILVLFMGLAMILYWWKRQNRRS